MWVYFPVTSAPILMPQLATQLLEKDLRWCATGDTLQQQPISST